jgi:hypothetical protein
MGPAGDADRVGLGAGVVLVPQDVGGGQADEHVQPRGAKRVIVDRVSYRAFRAFPGIRQGMRIRW